MLAGSLLSALVLVANAVEHKTAISTHPGKFPETYQFSTTRGLFAVSNDSDQAVAITVTPVRPTDAVLSAPKVLAPHSTSNVVVAVTPQWEVGVRLHSFSVRTNGASKVLVYGIVKGFVESALDDGYPVVDLGVVDQRHPVKSEKSYVLQSKESPTLTIARILDVPEFVDVKVVDKGRRFVVSMKATESWGIKTGFVKLSLKGSAQTQAWVDVRADVHGDIVPFSNPFGFDVARQGQNNSFLIRLDRLDGRDFKVGKIELLGLKGDVGQQPCSQGDPKSCKLLKLHVADDQPTGKLSGKIIVNFPELRRSLSINVWGMLFRADAQIKELAAPSRDQSQALRAENLKSALDQATSVDVGTKLKSAVPTGDGPLLKWEVENEQALYGYVVYRAETENGAEQRINRSIIRTLSGGVGTKVEYSFRDTSAVPGHTYWYQIGTLDVRGVRQDLTGRVKKTYIASSKGAN
jgi:hypothetical protein